MQVKPATWVDRGEPQSAAELREKALYLRSEAVKRVQWAMEDAATGDVLSALGLARWAGIYTSAAADHEFTARRWEMWTRKGGR